MNLCVIIIKNIIAMSYYFSKKLTSGWDDTKTKVTEALKNEGFGILTEINIKETFKKKLDVDFRPYLILGACNPNFAFKALSAEKNIGTLLPCNVVMQQNEDGMIEVSVINPVVSMQAVVNHDLENLALEVSARLKRVIESL